MSLLECNNLTKRYGRKTALDGIHLSLESGRIVGLLGPNGSGKTTLIKLACGMLTPSEGEILIEGKRPGVETKSMVAYLSDREILPDYMKVGELVRFYEDFFEDFQREAALTMIEQLGLDRDMRYKKLSKGNREKVQLILVMSRKARLYFLDEPVAGVDPAARDYILRTIIENYNPEALVVISTHLIADVESVLDEVVFIQNGSIVLQDNADELRDARGKSIDAIFREEFRC